MNRNQKIRARRAAKKADATPSIRPATNIAGRVQTVTAPCAVVRRSTAVKMTGAQRDSRGKRSDWSRSATGPSLFTDPKWGYTVSDGRLSGLGR